MAIGCRRAPGLLLEFCVAVLLSATLASPAAALTSWIANGLAPPNAANVVDHTNFGLALLDTLIVRDEGCAQVSGECTHAGSATRVALVDGGGLSIVLADDTSHIDLLGGTVYGLFAAALDSSSLTLDGTTLLQNLEVNDSATGLVRSGSVGADVRAIRDGWVRIEGGSFGGSLNAWGGTIEVVGSNFAINGVAVGPGEILAFGGRLTGTLSSGDFLDVAFDRDHPGTVGDGSIVLITSPEPGTGLLVAAGLVLIVARRRRSS